MGKEKEWIKRWVRTLKEKEWIKQVGKMRWGIAW